MLSAKCPHRWAAAILLLLGFALTQPSVSALYVRPDLIDVPVERLIRNLEGLAKNDPKNIEVRFNLARAHAMAYALKTESARVWRGRENDGVWFGHEPTHIPFVVTPTDDKTKLETAKEHLANAIERYAEVVELAPDNLAAALGYAWCIEQSGQKQKAIKQYRLVVDAAWENEKDLKRARLGWHSVTAEAAGYLIPLLDENIDRREIDTLRKRKEQLGMVPRPITPIVIPLRDDLSARDLEETSASVAFDADGTGLRKRWTWITANAGWLVYDPHRTARITSGLQMFGSVTFWMFWENGYRALSALDDDCDGFLVDQELEGLAIWQDLNSNAISERGEVKRLAELGIVGLSCRYVVDLERQDRIAYSPRGVFFRDGSSRPTYDIILHPAIATID